VFSGQLICVVFCEGFIFVKHLFLMFCKTFIFCVPWNFYLCVCVCVWSLYMYVCVCSVKLLFLVVFCYWTYMILYVMQ
jgi:hypothetical protein